MKTTTLTLTLALLLAAATATAQTTREQIEANPALSAGNYLQYPYLTQEPPAPLAAPAGYKPVYISHYGRHGSRWLIDPRQYTDVVDVLQRAHEAQKLTPRGELLLAQAKAMAQSAKNRLGELTGVGERQHHRIGRRMAEHFPEIFKAKDCKVDARSTVVIRCILSMEAECEELAKANPFITIHNDVSEGLQYYLNAPWSRRINEANAEKWKRVFDYNKAYVHPTRFWSQIINDADYRDTVVTSRGAFMKRVFDLAGNMQSHFDDVNGQRSTANTTLHTGYYSNDVLTVDGCPLTADALFDLFTPQEAYDLWRANNISWYVNYASAISPFTQKNLLQNFLSTADTIVHQPAYRGATLRFGHEVCVMPMAALLELGDAYAEVPMEGLDTLDRQWANYRIFPMASNIQLVFYRPRKGRAGDILVKALLNEREQRLPVATTQYPYYRWDDLEAYYRKKIAAYDAHRQ